jgi:hypothetical protein
VCACVCACACACACAFYIAAVIACLMFKVYLKNEDLTSFTVLTEKEGKEIKV